MNNELNEEIKTLNERIKKLEVLQRNFRIAMIVVVGFMIYDAFAPDTGSNIVFAHKVKARQFELVDGAGTVFGYWKQTDDGTDSNLRLQAANGSGVKISSQAVEVFGASLDHQADNNVRITATGLMVPDLVQQQSEEMK